MMTGNGRYNKEVADKLLAIAVKLDTASAKLDATAATLADSIATMNSQQLVSQTALAEPVFATIGIHSTPTSNFSPISSVSEESSIATLPRNATHEEQKAYAEYMSRNYESGIEDLRAALDLANRNSFSNGDPMCRNTNHQSRSRLGGKKITKKRTVRRKRTYKKSKRSSYKKSKRSYKGKRSVKRGGVTSDSIDPITFTISIPYIANREKPRSFQIVLNSNQTGKDLINKMNLLLNRGVIYLTKKERDFPRKLVFPDGTPVKYHDRLEFYWSDTLILPLKNEDRLIAAAPVAAAAAAAAPVARAAAAGPNPRGDDDDDVLDLEPARGDDDDVLDPNPAPPVAVPPPRGA